MNIYENPLIRLGLGMGLGLGLGVDTGAGLHWAGLWWVGLGLAELAWDMKVKGRTRGE